MSICKRIIAVSTASASVFTCSITPNIFAAENTSALLDMSSFTIMDENIVQLGAGHLRDASYLFDDQDKVPASPDNTNVEPELWEATSHSNWKPNEQSDYGENSFYIDFGANYVITGFCFLDSNGINEWKMETGTPFGWTESVSFTTDWYNAWRGITIDEPVPTRYLRFSTGNGDTGISELAIYGYKESELTDEQKAITAPKPYTAPESTLTAGQTVGFNAFIDDPMTAIMAAGNVREYHNLSWLIDSDGKVKFTQGSWGDMDSYYSAMKEQNISIIPCIQGGSSAIYGKDSYPEIAAPDGADTLDPASYTIHAQALYQIAARYGSNKEIDLSTINITDAQEVQVGMGLLDAVENSNEPNKGWSGKANYYTPYELAAMCSADYDGHEGTIPNAGVKNADPDFRLAMGGLVGTSTMIDYLSQMKLWFDYNRSDGKFAVDIINVHIGPDDVNPETSSFKETINKLQTWIDENIPGTELWISEFEVPMSDCETEGVDNHDNELYQLRYAQRVARTYLTAIGLNVDRVSKFQLRDEGEGVYYNSGLVTQKGSWEKKTAWYYVSCMTDVLENADFAEDVSTKNVSIYKFTERTSNDTIYCFWSPTSNGTEIPNFKFTADGKYAYLTQPSEYAEGTTENLAIQNGEITLTVTETPVFVRFSGTEQTVVNGKGKYIKPESICLTADKSTEICNLSSAPEDNTLNQFYRMLDEPNTMPKFIYGSTSSLSAPETNVTKSGITCYADLGGQYILTGFGIYDTFGTGSFEIYNADTDQLIWSSDMGGYMYRNIAVTKESSPVSTLKIVKGGGDLNEIAVYGYPVPEKAENVHYDVNADGTFSIADAVMMQKYLSGIGELIDAYTGDADKNGRINIFDLILMKNNLLLYE